MGILLLAPSGPPATPGSFALFDEVHVWRVKKTADVDFDTALPLPVGAAIPDGQTIIFGTPAVPDTTERIVRIPAAAFRAGDDTMTWDVGSFWLDPRVAASSQNYWYGTVLPAGVIITSFDVRGYRNTGSDIFELWLYRIDELGGSTALVNQVALATGGWSELTNALSEVVGTEHYWIRVRLRGDSVDSDARLLWARYKLDLSSLLEQI